MTMSATLLARANSVGSRDPLAAGAHQEMIRLRDEHMDDLQEGLKLLHEKGGKPWAEVKKDLGL